MNATQVKYSESIFLSYKTTGCCFFVISVIVTLGNVSQSLCADVVILKALWRLHCHVASLPHMIILYTDLDLRVILYTQHQPSSFSKCTSLEILNKVASSC